MKKILLSLLALAATVMGASADSLRPKAQGLQMPVSGLEAAGFQVASVDMPTPQGPQRIMSEGSIDYYPGGEPYTAMGFNNVAAGYVIAQAIEITPAMATNFAGNTVSAINFYSGVRNISTNATNRNYILTYTVFLTYDYEEEPFYSQTASAGPYFGDLNQITLDTPYTIEAGKRFYVGIKCTLKNPNDLVLVVDGMYTGNDTAGYIGLATSESGSLSWNNYASQVGSLCIGFKMTGMVPTDEAEMESIAVQPVINANTPFSIDVNFYNRGANTMTSVDLDVKVGDQEPQTVQLQAGSSIAYNALATATIDGLTYPTVPEGPLTVTVTATKVNGTDNTNSGKTMSATTDVLPEGAGYKRVVVLEEGTSINCGWCPGGIVGCQYVREHYTDVDGSMIPVAVHSKFNGADPMESFFYSQFLSDYISGFPSAWVNRYQEIGMGYYRATDLYAEIERGYNLVRAIPGLVEVTATAKWETAEKKAIVFDTKFKSCLDESDAKYLLSFFITEDQVGPYQQNNYYAGGASQGYNMDGWQNKGASVSTIYDDVARKLDNYKGITGSVPAQLVSGQEYDFTHRTTIPSSVVNVENINLGVMVRNTVTGVIENAFYIKGADIAPAEDSAIDDILAPEDVNAPVEYFNLQGQRVANPEGGVFIKRQGSTVTKVIK